MGGSREPEQRSIMASRLQTAANIAVLLASMAVIWTVWQRSQAPPPPEPPPTYAIGERIEAVPGIDFRAAAQTLVMALREDCRFCADSVPFYQKLTAAAGATPRRAFQLTVVSTDSQSALIAYLQANGVMVDHVVSTRPGDLKIPGTPHLLLVDTNGIVRRVWRGRLAAEQEQEVIDALGLTAMN
jgi:hypothetical protein